MRQNQKYSSLSSTRAVLLCEVSSAFRAKSEESRKARPNAIMKIMQLIAYISFFTFVWEFSSCATVNDKLTVSKVDRTIDISSQLARVSLEITIENGSPEAVQSFLIGIDPEHASHLAFASASVSIIFSKFPLSSTFQYLTM